MFDELISAFKKAIKRLRRAFKALFREIKQRWRCGNGKHRYAIQSWRYVNHRRAVVARLKCVDCGFLGTKLIHDPAAVRRIKKHAGSLREEGRSSV